MFAHPQVVQLYFEDSGSKLEKLALKLSGNDGSATGGAGSIDYNDVDQLVHQFKGSSASFGAQSIAAACVRLREACLAHDAGTCQALLQHIQQQFQVCVTAAWSRCQGLIPRE
jgi:histidine-containing phosphotransfer peotein